MCEFCGKDDLAGGVVYQGDTRGAAPRIELEPQWLYLWLLNFNMQDNRERETSPDGGFPLRKEHACPSWVNRVERSVRGINDKNFAHMSLYFRR